MEHVTLGKILDFIMDLNYLVNTGKYGTITAIEVDKVLRTRNIIDWLEERVARDADFSLWGPEYRSELTENLRDTSDAYSREVRKFSNGLCFLISLAIILIRSGAAAPPVMGQ
jgi:hypothetical protein